MGRGGGRGAAPSLAAYRCCPLQMLQTEIQGLKDQVQELHRDLTKHHSLIRTEIMSEILQKSLQMDVQIAAHYSSVEMMRSVFEEVGARRVLPHPGVLPTRPTASSPLPAAGLGGDVPEGGERAGDLRRYGHCPPCSLRPPPGEPRPQPRSRPPAQLHDLLQLRQENSCLTTITKQIAPYVRSIAKVKERLEPR